MNRRNLSTSGASGMSNCALALALLFACPAFAYKGEALARGAKIRIEGARAIALNAHPGKITDEELER